MSEAPKTKYGYEDGPNESYVLDKQAISPEVTAVYAELQKLPQGSVVADIGSGAGRLIKNAPKERPYTFLGIELDASAVKKFDKEKATLGLSDQMVVASATELNTGSDGITFDAAVSWRVLHNFDEETQRRVCEDVFAALPPGGSFYVSVLSDQDWKLRKLRETGEVDLHQLVDSERVMDLVENQGKAPEDPTRKRWPLYYFTRNRLQELAQQSGLEIVGDITTFKERSGMPHLLAYGDERSEITYYNVHFRKPQ